jgi:hypothetical protein
MCRCTREEGRHKGPPLYPLRLGGKRQLVKASVCERAGTRARRSISQGWAERDNKSKLVCVRGPAQGPAALSLKAGPAPLPLNVPWSPRKSQEKAPCRHVTNRHVTLLGGSRSSPTSDTRRGYWGRGVCVCGGVNHASPTRTGGQSGVQTSGRGGTPYTWGCVCRRAAGGGTRVWRGSCRRREGSRHGSGAA